MPFKKNKPRRTRSRKLQIIGIGLLAATVISAVYLWQTGGFEGIEAEKYYFVDSDYSDVQSKFINHNYKNGYASLEYPVTRNKDVNQTVEAYINKKRDEFKELAEGNTQKGLELFTSYQISYRHNSYISMTVSSVVHGENIPPFTEAQSWTFNLKNGKTIKLADLMGGSPDGLERIMITLRSQVRNNPVFSKQDRPSDAELRETINTSNVTDFAVADSTHLLFDFGGAAGEGREKEKNKRLIVKIPIVQLVNYLQNDTARGMLDVVRVSQMPLREAEEQTVSSNHTAMNNCGAKKCIALTFDDGPGRYTSQLLDTLKQYNAKATFFLIGRNINLRQAVVERMSKEGHLIGNHSWSHVNLTSVSTERIQTELQQTNAAIKAVTGIDTQLARPPYGAANESVYGTLKHLNMSAIFWSIDTRDWADRNSDIICRRATTGARSGGIIIMHDIHPTTVNAVPCIAKNLEARGFSLVTVEDILGSNLRPGEGYRGL